MQDQKSTHFPFISQSPYLVGSGPLGLSPYSGYIGFPVFLSMVTFNVSLLFWF